MTDIDDLLSRMAPTIVGADEISNAMGATARTIAATAVRRRTARRSTATVIGTAAAVAAVALALPGRQAPAPIATQTPVGVTQLELVAANAVPAGLPLPDGVTINDARAFVVGLVQKSPGLREWGAYALDHGVLVAHDKGQPANLPRQFQ